MPEKLTWRTGYGSMAEDSRRIRRSRNHRGGISTCLIHARGTPRTGTGLHGWGNSPPDPWRRDVTTTDVAGKDGRIFGLLWTTNRSPRNPERQKHRSRPQ